MAERDQLEVITPDGEITFFSLDPQGITDIGQDTANDVVLAGPGVAPVQATIDHRDRPARIMFLEGGLQPAASGEPAPLATWIPMPDGQPFQLGDYVLIWMGRRQPRTPGPSPERGSGGGTKPDVNLFEDIEDEYVIVKLAQRVWDVDPGQTVTAELTVANGSHFVDWFDVSVAGVPGAWVQLSSRRVELYDGQEKPIGLSITPPREPASRAEPYVLAITVSSFTDPDHSSRLGARLDVNPYYASSDVDLTDALLRVRWHERCGTTILRITNRGNSTTTYRVSGPPDERAAHLAFPPLSQEELPAGQAEIRIQPGETGSCRIRIAPPRRLIALRDRTYHYAFDTIRVEDAERLRDVAVDVLSLPLIGRRFIILCLLIAAAITFIVLLRCG